MFSFASDADLIRDVDMARFQLKLDEWHVANLTPEQVDGRRRRFRTILLRSLLEQQRRRNGGMRWDDV